VSLDVTLSGRCSDDVSRLPVIIRIQEDCTPEVASALDILHKEMKKRNLERNGKRPQRGGETRDSEIETAIIQALAPLQNTLGFEELISKTNDYNQTLAHFAVLFGYINLLRRLVGWNIDLSIADVNGFTALHCAYKKGDRACIDLLVENGALETVLDALGRAPSHLMPEGFDSLKDYDTDMASDDQKLEQGFDALSLYQTTDSGHGGSDSDEEGSMDNAGRAYQGGLDQMDVHYPVASTSKAPVGGSTSRPRSMKGIRIRKIRRIADVPNDADVNSVAAALQERLAEPEAVQYLRKEVFPTGEISLSALRAPNSEATRGTVRGGD
jgi:ankyrin repeat protein